jgi:hypothetical protein
VHAAPSCRTKLVVDHPPDQIVLEDQSGHFIHEDSRDDGLGDQRDALDGRATQQGSRVGERERATEDGPYSQQLASVGGDAREATLDAVREGARERALVVFGSGEPAHQLHDEERIAVGAFDQAPERRVERTAADISGDLQRRCGIERPERDPGPACIRPVLDRERSLGRLR